MNTLLHAATISTFSEIDIWYPRLLLWHDAHHYYCLLLFGALSSQINSDCDALNEHYVVFVKDSVQWLCQRARFNGMKLCALFIKYNLFICWHNIWQGNHNSLTNNYTSWRRMMVSLSDMQQLRKLYVMTSAKFHPIDTATARFFRVMSFNAKGLVCMSRWLAT